MRLHPVRVAGRERRYCDQGDQEVSRGPMHRVKSRGFDAVGWGEVMCESSCQRLNDLLQRIVSCKLPRDIIMNPPSRRE